MGMGDYGSHFPILATAVARTVGPVLELGCGDWSTPMLHYMCKNRYLLSADGDLEWLRKFAGGYSCPRRHEFRHVPNWEQWTALEDLHWSVALVDCAPGEERWKLIKRLAHRCMYIVAHDSETDYKSGGNYQYDKIIPLFEYVSEFCRFRPYTLVLSNEREFGIEECDKTWKPPKS